MRILKLWIIAGVSLVHLAIIALLLNVATAPIVPTQLSVVDITFVDPEPIIDASAAPEPEDDFQTTETIEETQPPEQDLPIPDPRPADTMANASDVTHPEVLVQLEGESVQLDAVPLAEGGPIDTIGSDQIATVLTRLSCRSLTRRPKQNCPKPDPFAAADAAAARDAQAHNPTAIAFEVRLNTAEQFFAKQKEDRHMFPGMNADMFVDTQSPGAYTADRISDGHEPLWSEDLKRGFKTSE